MSGTSARAGRRRGLKRPQFCPPKFTEGQTPEDCMYRNRFGRWVRLGDINDSGVAAIFRKLGETGKENTAWWYLVRDVCMRRGIIDGDGKLKPGLDKEYGPGA